MRKNILLFGIVFTSMFAVFAYSQSLADIANKEKERRSEIKNDKVITKEQMEKYLGHPEEPEISNEAEKKENAPDRNDKIDKNASAEASSAKGEKKESEEETDFQGRPESYWRKTMTDARKKVSDLENEANSIVLRLADLQNKFYAEDDGFKREGIQRDMQKGYYEQDKNKEALEKAKSLLMELETEARKSGALPGWIE
jgi:hypothetical protein